MSIRRREFIGGIGAASVAGGAFDAFGGEKPLLRMGVMTDTHIGTTKDTCKLVKLACRLFRKHSVDLIVNVGDVADYHFPTGYKAYRETVEEVFAKTPPAKRPKELFVYAGHDHFAYKGAARKDWQGCATPAFADMQRLIGASNGPYATGDVNGFPYVVLPQRMSDGLDLSRCEKMIAEACAANHGKPVFVFAHIPPANTTREGRGSPDKTALFSKYPQVVNISGHTHGSLADERSIWQGAFTSVNAGCLQNWGDGRSGIAGNNVRRINNYGVLVVDVYASRIVFRRFDVRDGAECHAPWIVPWPHNPSSAPYAPANRKDIGRVPSFAADAVLRAEPSKAEDGGVSLSIPSAVGEPRPFAYRVRLERMDAGGKWVAHARRDFFGDFWQRAKERPAGYAQEFASAYFAEGGKFRFRVAAVNSWGREGSPLETVFDAPVRKTPADVAWSCRNPMEECRFLGGLSGGTPKMRIGDFYEMDKGAARLEIPKEAWAGPAGTPFRLVLDMHTVQESDPTWTVVLRNPNPLKNASGRLSTPPGDSGMLRYVIDIRKLADNHAYYLLIREGGAGKIRFGSVRVERL